MAVQSSPSCWYGKTIPRKKHATKAIDRLRNSVRSSTQDIGSFIEEWTPFLLVASYFVFSVSMYTFCSDTLIECFWFIYLTTNFYIAGSTVVEALYGVTPTHDSRKALQQVSEKGFVWPTQDDKLPFLDLIIVSLSKSERLYDLDMTMLTFLTGRLSAK